MAPLGCRVLGHRYRFTSEGATMRWACQRDCGASGSKRYATAAEADRYARAFDREDGRDLGRRAPVGLLPMLLIRALCSRRGRRDSGSGTVHGTSE